MKDEDYGLAMNQLARLESFGSVQASLPQPPVSMPPDPFRAAGIDPGLWSGLGIVGIWAAMDALGERANRPKGGLLQRFGGPRKYDNALEELDDLRNLFAHNFAGIADREYLDHPKRRRLKLGFPCTLGCGYQFQGLDGEQITLTLHHLAYYIEKARQILTSFH
jgi:hypothetical protein